MRLDGLDFADCGFAAPTVYFCVKRHLLTLNEMPDACALQRGRMDENVLAAIGGLNEAEASLLIIEFHSALNHGFAFRKVVSAQPWPRYYGNAAVVD